MIMFEHKHLIEKGFESSKDETRWYSNILGVMCPQFLPFKLENILP